MLSLTVGLIVINTGLYASAVMVKHNGTGVTDIIIINNDILIMDFYSNL